MLIILKLTTSKDLIPHIWFQYVMSKNDPLKSLTKRKFIANTEEVVN